jgi:hypothetical protein
MKQTISSATLFLISLLPVSLRQSQPATPYAPETNERSKIIARLALTGKTGSIPPTTIFTPETDGLFRVSVYTEIMTSTWQSMSLCGNLSWYDDSPFLEQTPVLTGFNGVGTGTINSLGCLNTLGPEGPTGNFTTREVVIRAKAHKPVTIDTVLTSPVSPFAYSMHIIAEQL